MRDQVEFGNKFLKSVWRMNFGEDIGRMICGRDIYLKGFALIPIEIFNLCLLNPISISVVVNNQFLPLVELYILLFKIHIGLKHEFAIAFKS